MTVSNLRSIWEPSEGSGIGGNVLRTSVSASRILKCRGDAFRDLLGHENLQITIRFLGECQVDST
jgi:hypothetical protein